MGRRFQGGKFDKVRFLQMDDHRPFEHKLFEIISQDFPFLQKLAILNYIPQENKQHHSSILIKYNNLFEMNLVNVHPNYAIQFLSDKKTCLPSLTKLKVMSKTLATVTNNFTNDETRFNCQTIKSRVTGQTFDGTQNFYSYFPSLSILVLYR